MPFNQNDPDDLAALKSEVESDPLAIGYTVLTDGNTGKFLNEINAKNYTVSKPTISSSKVRAATTYAAYNNLAIDEQEWLRWIAPGSVDEDIQVTDDIRTQLTTSSTFWAAGDRAAMQAAMLALMDVPGSRAEVLFGYGTIISSTDWFAARDS